MTHRALLILFASMVLTGTAEGQQPYAGLETRPIKALSSEQIEDLRNGRGMSLALAAELNGYPGPLHVLELSGGLNLTDAQRSRVQGLLGAMKAETIPLGEKLIALETDLDRQFASRTITASGLAAATDAIGATQGALRGAHLKYHLLTLAELTPAQLAQYNQLRGYGAHTPSTGHPHRH